MTIRKWKRSELEDIDEGDLEVISHKSKIISLRLPNAFLHWCAHTWRVPVCFHIAFLCIRGCVTTFECLFNVYIAQVPYGTVFTACVRVGPHTDAALDWQRGLLKIRDKPTTSHHSPPHTLNLSVKQIEDHSNQSGPSQLLPAGQNSASMHYHRYLNRPTKWSHSYSSKHCFPIIKANVKANVH